MGMVLTTTGGDKPRGTRVPTTPEVPYDNKTSGVADRKLQTYRYLGRHSATRGIEASDRRPTGQPSTASRKGIVMATVTVGKPVPDFELPATGEQTVRLADLKGQNVVLYFYPKDNTPGCTLEGQNFRDMHPQFKKMNAVILGISRDSVDSHETFKENQSFPFDLLADEQEKVCKLFDVMKPKNMYGKEVIGVERSTFLIDAGGVLRQEWRKVKVEGHADAVLAAIKAL